MMKRIPYISAKTNNWDLGRFESIHAMALVVGVQYGRRFKQFEGVYYLDGNIIKIEHCERLVKAIA